MHLYPRLSSSSLQLGVAWIRSGSVARWQVLGLHFVAWPSEMSCIRSYSSCRRCILNAPALARPHSHVLQLPGHGLPLHPVSCVGVCGVCVCLCVRTLFLFLCASAFPLGRHWKLIPKRRRQAANFDAFPGNPGHV